MTAPTRPGESTAGWLLCRYHGRGCDEFWRYWHGDFSVFDAEADRYRHEPTCPFRPGIARYRSIGPIGDPRC